MAEIDKFFDYMEGPKEKKVKLVACRLKGAASAWWERLQNKRLREGKQLVKMWYRMKQLLKKDFLPLTMSRFVSSNTKGVIKELGQSMNTLLNS